MTFHAHKQGRGFTLIELMVVVAIMALIMGISIPFAKTAMNREALTQAIMDVEEVCRNARSQAIFHGSMSQLVFHAKDATMNVEGHAPGNTEASSSGGPPASGMAAKLSDQVVIGVLNINGIDCMEFEQASVRFFPNGTCDDMTMILKRTDDRERYEITLEATTGLVFIESDRSKFRTKQ